MAEEKGKFDWKRFVKVQQSLPHVEKGGKGNYGTYMKLEDLNPALLKVLNDNGFAWTTMPIYVGEKRALSYQVIDMESGDFIGGVMDLVMAQDSPQAQGSAITYARRYALCAITGLVADMDDDGQAAESAFDAQAEQDRMQTNPAALVELGKMLEDKGIEDKEDRALLFDALTPGKDFMKLNTTGVSALRKAIMTAAPDTLERVLINIKGGER